MAQLAIAAAGAAIGGWLAPVGWTFLGMSGAAIGWGVGSAIGGSLFAPTQKFEGPRLQDLRVTGTEYGQAIPWIRGHPRVAGQIIWASAKREISHTTSSGGKGGGGSESTTYTYEVDVLYVVSDNEIADVTRIWKNGELVYTKLAASDSDSISASLDTPHWTRMSVYTGAATQTPDPDYETAVGAADAPAYRGRGTVFVKALQLDGGGNLPNLTFEVTVTGSVGTAQQTTLAQLTDSSASGGFSAANCPAASADGGVTLLLGLGTWTNTYVRPFTVRVHEYNVALDRYAFQRSFDVFPDGADGDRLSFASVSTDYPMWAGASPRVGNERAMIYDLTDGTSIQHYWSGFGGGETVTAVARRGSTIIYAQTKGAVAGALARFAADTGAAAPIVSATPAAPSFTHICISEDEANVYGVNDAAATIRRLDTATLTVQESFAAPTSSGRLFIWPDASLGWHDMVSPWKVYKRVSGAWTEKATKAGTLQFNGSERGNETFYGDSWLFSWPNTAGVHKLWKLDHWDTITPSDVTVQSVVEALCARTGLTAGQYDASALSSITRNVRGLALAQVGPVRSPLEMLAGAYFFEAVVSDKIYFRPRGGSSVVTIPFLDLAAHEGSVENVPEPLALTLRTDIELPAHLAATYLNANDDYQPDTQLSDRRISAVANTVASTQLPLALTPSEAKGIVDAASLDALISLTGTKISLLGDYARLEPTDIVTATARDGSTFRLRLVKKTDAYPVQEFDAVLDDASVLTSQGITSADYTSTTSVVAVPATDIELMDIPILRDADDDAGFYHAAKGVDTPWPGEVLFGSRDDVQWEEKARITESAVTGIATTALGNWSGGRVFDYGNTVAVDVGLGALASSTRDTVLNDQSVNAMMIGSEIVQFVTATLTAAGRYTLSEFLRGGRGTEWAMTGHAAGERCVLLQMTGLRRVRMETSELGFSRYYRGVTLVRRIDSATSETFTNNGVGLKPFSPFDLRAVRSASGTVFTMQRRTRLAVRTTGALGISIPLGEDEASYELHIYDGAGYATLKRTLTASALSFTYANADEITDFGSQQSTYYCRAYQRSAQVGLGYKLQAAA